MRHWIAIAVIIACSSCASPPRPAAVVAVTRPTGPVITRFVMRHQVIVARAGVAGGEPTYSLESRGGDVLVPDMTVGQLAATHPDLHRTIRTMQTAVLWAGD